MDILKEPFENGPSEYCCNRTCKTIPTNTNNEHYYHTLKKNNKHIKHKRKIKMHDARKEKRKEKKKGK